MNYSVRHKALYYALIGLMLLHTSLALAQWRNISPPEVSDAILFGVDFYTEDIGIVAGQNIASGEGVIARTTDGGASWTTTHRAANSHLRAVGFFHDDLTYVVGYDGPPGTKTVFITSDNEGESWSTAESSDITGLNEIHIVSERTAYAIGYGRSVGFSASVLKSDDGGANWSIAFEQDGQYMSGMRFVDETTGYVGITDFVNGGVLKTVDGGANWEFIEVGAFIHDIWFVDNVTGFVLAESLYRTDDGGTTWTELPIADGMKRIAFISSDIGYAMGNQGQVLKTTDGGHFWTEEETGTAVEFEYMEWREANLYVVGRQGTVLHKDISDDVATLPAIAVQPELGELDFGAAPLGESREMEFDIANTGGSALTIHALDVHNESGAAFAVSQPQNSPITIAPGATQTIVVGFTPTMIGKAVGRLVLSSNAINRKVVNIELSGSGTETVSVGETMLGSDVQLIARLAFATSELAPQAIICELSGYTAQEARIVIFDVAGVARYKAFRGMLEPGISRIRLFTDSFTSGAYYAIIETQGKSISLPFIIVQ